MGYRIIETTADIGVEAWGASFTELCSGFLDGLYAIAFTEAVTLQGDGVRVVVDAGTQSDAVFALIEEAVFRLYAKRQLLRVERSSGAAVTATAVDAPRQELAVEIKAATRHRFAVEQTPDNRWSGTCILDI